MIIKLIPNPIKSVVKKIRNKYFLPLFIKSYSQEGEDMVLRRIFEGRPIGFYVDVGSFHPMRYSNTHSLYIRGWNGINIDPNPDTHELFKKHRSRDVNILTAVFPISGKRKYFMFKEPAYNTLDHEKAQECRKYTDLLSEISVECAPLSEILKVNIRDGQKIDLLNIDVEGLDLKVLESNDWDKFKPEVIIVEQIDVLLNDIKSSDIAIYLESKGYHSIAKTVNSVFYKHSSNNLDKTR